MNAQTANKKGFRVALISFLVAGLLAIMLLASLGTSWGVAYGQSAGPTFTPGSTTAAPTTAAPTTVAQSNSNPTGVGDSNTQPNTNPSVVGDANQAPVGVVPGLPNTGTGSPATDDNSWKLIVLGLLLANMLIAGLVMGKFSRSSKSR